ncbi:hypothetical protein M8494_19085 [Serratia ureilytica]
MLVITRFGDALGALTLPLSAFVGGILSAMAVMILFRVSRVRRRAVDRLWPGGLIFV